MNSLILWDLLPAGKREEYINYLKIFGALSGLFKDIENGNHADKPYLYYRNHEKLFAKVFGFDDLSRNDSAFDAVASIGNCRIGIGLKTWMHLQDITFQKVAEFNKVALTEIKPLLDQGSASELITKIALLRNERIELDKRTYQTTHTIYHNITRDNNLMNIVESRYNTIDLNSLKLVSVNNAKSVFNFKDKNKQYKFYVSKSVLLQEFDASKDSVLHKIPISQAKDPFDLLAQIQVTPGLQATASIPLYSLDIGLLSMVELANKKENVIYLPIYSDRSYKVEEKSGFNAWNAAPKTKGSDRDRPDFEAYIPIPIWIHHIFPGFFGFNALDREERGVAKEFKLILPSGKFIKAIVTQDNGKSLQTDPQSVLGKWILNEVFGLQPRELLTMKRLRFLGVDSLKITRIDNNNFKIDLADTHAFEKWKLELQTDIEMCSAIKRKPSFRPDLIEEEEE